MVGRMLSCSRRAPVGKSSLSFAYAVGCPYHVHRLQGDFRGPNGTGLALVVLEEPLARSFVVEVGMVFVHQRVLQAVAPAL